MLVDGEVEEELTNQHRLEFIKIYPTDQLAFSSTVNKYNHFTPTGRYPLHWIGVPTFPDWQNSLTFPVFFSNFPVFLQPANEVCEGYVFTCVCHSVHSRSPGRVVSQHALQVFRPTPRGKLRGLAWGGGLQAHPQGGLQAHTQVGVYPSMHWGRPPPWQLLLQAVCIILEYILVLVFCFLYWKLDPF